MKLEEFRKKVTYKSHVKNYRIVGNPKAMHLVYDPGTFRIMCFSPWISTVNTLNETKVNTVAKYWQNYPGYSVLPEGCTVKQAYLCKWDDVANKWVLSADDLTEEELYSYCLMIEKAAILDEMYQRILHYRRPIINSIHMQDTVYQLKYDEAVEIKNCVGEIEEPWNWPFVNDYADIQKIDIKTAAEEIIFKHKLFKTRLSNTETIRIKYTREIKACEKLEDLDGIINRFYTEGEIYGRL